MRAWKIAGLALNGLRRTPLRLFLTALGVAIGSGALVSMVGFSIGLQQFIETPFQSLGLLDNIEVKPRGQHDEDGPGGKEKPDDKGEPERKGPPPVLNDEALARMEALPGVVAAYPDFRMRGLKLVRGEQSESVVAIGLPRTVGLYGGMADLLVAGRFFSVDEEPEVILGEQIAKELGFERARDAVGNFITLEAGGLTPGAEKEFRFEEKKLRVKVVGVYQLPAMMPRVGHRGILLPVDLMKQLPDAQFRPALDRLKEGRTATGAGYERVTVRVKHFSDLEPTEAAIREMGFEPQTMLSRMERMREFFVFMDVLLAAVGTVGLVIAALGIVNTLLMSVLERYQEIGICKAIGASDYDVAVIYLTEAGVIGLLGGLGGLALGRVVAWGLEIAVNMYAQGKGVTSQLDVFAFPGWLLAATVIFALVISVLAGVYPALRAARVDPIRALRRE